jgi:hypothetical protein
MITDMFTQLHERLLALDLIDYVIFVDGTKILADANKYSFVWQKNTIRYSELTQAKQNVRRISINPAWEYQKTKIRDSLNNQTNTEIYARRKRKIEVEPVFGRMKAHFGVIRFHGSWVGKV